MRIGPEESEIRASSELAGVDEAWDRIDQLVETYLVEIGSDASGWCTLYRDPNDGRYWELLYPQSHVHGGGPPTLRVVSIDQVRSKYEVA